MLGKLRLYNTCSQLPKIFKLDLHTIALGNKAFFANKKMFQSKLISKMAKLKLYCSVIRLVVTRACGTWTLKETITNRLMLFERKGFKENICPNQGKFYLANKNQPGIG